MRAKIPTILFAVCLAGVLAVFIIMGITIIADKLALQGYRDHIPDITGVGERNYVSDEGMFVDDGFLIRLSTLYTDWPEPVNYDYLIKSTTPLVKESVFGKVVDNFITEQRTIANKKRPGVPAFDLSPYRDRMMKALMVYAGTSDLTTKFNEQESFRIKNASWPLSHYFITRTELIVRGMVFSRVPAPEFLTFFPNMFELAFEICNADIWDDVNELTRLNVLSFNDCNLPAELPSLKKLTDLRVLELLDCKDLTKISFAGYPPNPKLKRLNLTGSTNIQSIVGLHAFAPGLRYLVLPKILEGDARVAQWVAGYTMFRARRPKAGGLQVQYNS